MAILVNGGAGVGLDSEATLSNKTLEAPVINNATFTGQQSGLEVAFNDSIIFEGTTANSFETTLSAGDPTADRVVTLPDATTTLVGTATTNTLTNKSISLASNTVTATLAELNTAISDADVASLAGSETLTNKTLTSPALTGGTIKDAVIKGIEEDVNVVASAATGTINFDIDTASIWYYTTNATANHTLNIRYSSSVSLNTALPVGDAITVVWMNTNGTTAYYPSTIQIDGNTVTPKVPSAITGGNASAIDVYSFTIIKTASATFTVLESQTKFA
jgi:hypothetical protein